MFPLSMAGTNRKSSATLLIDVMYHTASVIAPRTAEIQRRANIQTQEEGRLFCEGLSFHSGTSSRTL